MLNIEKYSNKFLKTNQTLFRTTKLHLSLQPFGMFANYPRKKTLQKTNWIPQKMVEAQNPEVKVTCHKYCMTPKTLSFRRFWGLQILIITAMVSEVYTGPNCIELLKSIGHLSVNCIVQRPTLRVSQLICKITNLWKFRLDRSSESRENNGKTHPCFRTLRRVMTCV